MTCVAEDVKRRYRSERRAEQAEETRRRVLDAARTLFEERGWDGASIVAIAKEARVSEETIYARFQNKRTLLGELVQLAVRGEDPRPIPEQEVPRALAAAHDQREQLRLFAADIALRLERAAPLVAIVAGASDQSPSSPSCWPACTRIGCGTSVSSSTPSPATGRFGFPPTRPSKAYGH